MGFKVRKAWALAFAPALVLAANTAFASGGQVVLRTDNGADGYYWNVGPAAGGGRYICEYLQGEFDPGTIVCGARFLELNQGSIPPPGEATADLRTEDTVTPNLTFPDLSPAGLIDMDPGPGVAPAVSDVASHGACLGGTSRLFTFNGGLGFAAPNQNIYISAIQPPAGTAGLDFCGARLDTTSAAQGFSKWWNGTTFGNLPWNHFIELNAFNPKLMDTNIRMSGSARFPGDAGTTSVWTTRKNIGSPANPSDDAITVAIAIDNGDGGPRDRTIRILADQSVINPKSKKKDVTNLFRTISTNTPLNGNTKNVLPVGRTIIKAHANSAAVKNQAAGIVNKLVGVNVPFEVLVDDFALDTDPLTLQGFPAVDDERQILGLRREAGIADDNAPENFFTVQAVNVFGDALNQQYPAIDMPKVPYDASGFELVGVNGDGAGTGLDAVELRSEDPVFSDEPDLTAVGLMTSAGTADSAPDGLVFPGTSPVTAVFDCPNTFIDPTVNPALVDNLFACAQFLAGEVGGPTFVGADGSPDDTLLGNSTFTVSGQHPATNSLNNWCIRLLTDNDPGSLNMTIPPIVSPNATRRALSEGDVAIDVNGNRIR